MDPSRFFISPGPDKSTAINLLSVTWIFTSLASLTVVLKIWTRVKLIRQWGLDDILTAFSTIFLLIFAVVITFSVRAGLGRHVFYLKKEDRIRAIKLAIIVNPFLILTSALPNVSVAIAWNKILVPPSRWQLGFLFGIPILQCIISVISSVVSVTECSPPQSLWNNEVPGDCISGDAINAILYLNSAFSAFTDVFLAIVPIVALWNLQMKTRTKVGVCLLMGTTAIASIAAIVRTIYVANAVIQDLTYTIYRVIDWVTIEASFMIIAACIPSLRPFVKVLGRSIRKSAPKPPVLMRSRNERGINHHANQPLNSTSQASGTTAVQMPAKAYRAEKGIGPTASTQNLRNDFPASVQSFTRSPTINNFDLENGTLASSVHSV